MAATNISIPVVISDSKLKETCSSSISPQRSIDINGNPTPNLKYLFFIYWQKRWMEKIEILMSKMQTIS